jgi:hypothetical protein
LHGPGEDDVPVRSRLVVLVLGTVLVAAGCGGSQPASRTTADARVNTGLCQASRVAGKPTANTCTFVLNDGRRLGCNRSFVGPTPSVSQLLRDGCRWLTPLNLSASVRALIARIDSVRSCLTSQRLRAVGGAMLPPNPPGPAQPDGELVITSRGPSFIAFYTSVARARRLEPAILRTAAQSHVQIERRGAVTIAWSRAPAGPVRDTVWTCVSG